MKAAKSFLFSVKLILLALAGICTGAFFTAVLLSAGYNVDVTATVLTIGAIAVLVAFVPKQKGVLNAVTVEIWTEWIAANLFKTNPFLDKCHKADQYVLGGSVVHIPQAGAIPSVVKNRTQFPANVTHRQDTDVTYALDVYTTDPTAIMQAEQYEISYDKMASVFGEMVQGLNESIADELLYKWRPEGSAFVATDGENAAATAPGATGNRKITTVKSVRKCQTALNKQKAGKNNRYMLLTSEMLGQLQDDPELKQRDNAKELDMLNGVIVRLHGFEIMERTDALIADMSGSPVIKAIGADSATSDSECGLAWQQDAVERALGTVEFFEKLKDPQFYADIYSALVKMGGRKRRADGVGVVGLYQAAGS